MWLNIGFYFTSHFLQVDGESTFKPFCKYEVLEIVTIFDRFHTALAFMWKVSKQIANGANKLHTMMRQSGQLYALGF